jgi:hypothetical protein
MGLVLACRHVGTERNRHQTNFPSVGFWSWSSVGTPLHKACILLIIASTVLVVCGNRKFKQHQDDTSPAGSWVLRYSHGGVVWMMVGSSRWLCFFVFNKFGVFYTYIATFCLWLKCFEGSIYNNFISTVN